MEAKARPTAAEEVEMPPRGTAHLPGSRRGTDGQQRRGEGNPPCGPDPQEQLRQRQREASADPGCSDDHYARTQPRADPGGCLEIHVRPGHLKTLPTKSTANG